MLNSSVKSGKSTECATLGQNAASSDTEVQGSLMQWLDSLYLISQQDFVLQLP